MRAIDQPSLRDWMDMPQLSQDFVLGYLQSSLRDFFSKISWICVLDKNTRSYSIL